MYRKYMHKYIFASIDWDINISIDFSLPNLKLSRLWRHGADLLRCTVTSPASWSKFQKWRTWESHASSIIFTVRNRLNRTESFQMTEKLIQWKKTSSETRAHSQISHSHSILGGQIFKQILSISFPRAPPRKNIRCFFPCLHPRIRRWSHSSMQWSPFRSSTIGRCPGSHAW